MAGLLQTSLIWVTYAVAIGLSLVAAVLTTWLWQTPRDRSALVSTVAIVSLTALLATVLLLPVDIALVSSTASISLGAKKDWATEQRVNSIILTLKIVYYSLYSFDALLCLLIIPFSYFWYEEYDEIEVEEEGRSLGSRLWAAMKYTLFFIALVVILFLLGFFVPAAGQHSGAHWDLDYYKRLLSENKGEKALTFGLGLLVTLGTILFVVYTGAGLALLPVSFIKAAPSMSLPTLLSTTDARLEEIAEEQRRINMRNEARPDSISKRDKRHLEELRREQIHLERQHRWATQAAGENRSWFFRFLLRASAFFRPVAILGGFLLLLISLLIWTSILITGIDKAKNSVCKQRCGYILGHTNIFQPINWIFMQSAKVFPIDYVLMALLVLLLFSSSIYGITIVGIRFLWVRIFQIRKGRTAPQAMLIATVMLALIILGINYTLAMMVAPQYAIYGTQTICTIEPRHPGEQPDCTNRPEMVVPCSELLQYPHLRDVCTPSVMSTFLNRITITWPFFGVVDFWAQFAFLGVFIVVFVTILFRTPRLQLENLEADAQEDEEEGLLASTGRRLGASWEDATGRPSRYGAREAGTAAREEEG
jgi:LMBR1 domain-containing protein 1